MNPDTRAALDWLDRHYPYNPQVATTLKVWFYTIGDWRREPPRDA